VPYTNQALRQDLLRVRTAWEDCQASRKRDAIYRYLTAVFNLVAWWAAESRALERAHKALRLQSICPFDSEEPFAAIIRCTTDPTKVDKRTRSKWSRALRYALRYKSHSEPLDQFIKRKGGINSCASRFTRCLEGVCAENSDSDVSVMKSADQRMRHNASDPLNSARDRCILVQ
jgi:hypothetical protein